MPQNVETLPDISTQNITSHSEVMRIIEQVDAEAAKRKAKTRIYEPHHITEQEYGAESYATIPMPVVLTDAQRPDPNTDKQTALTPRTMTFRWNSMWGYRDIAPMLYQARLDYYKKYGEYPRRMIVSRWNWTTAWRRNIRDYPLCMGRVGRDEVVCEG